MTNCEKNLALLPQDFNYYLSQALQTCDESVVRFLSVLMGGV